MSAIPPPVFVQFGDSLSDTGRLSDLTGQALLEPIPLADSFYDGKLSNGPVAIEIAADLLGFTADSHAIGGARALGSQTFDDFVGRVPPEFLRDDIPPELLEIDANLQGQIDGFAAAVAQDGLDPAIAAASILIGLNDLSDFGATLGRPLPFIIDLSGAILGAAEDLIDLGVGTVYLYTFPPAVFFPDAEDLSPALLALADFITGGLNTALTAGAAALAADTGATVSVLDFGFMAGEIAADPTTFGLTADYTTPVYEGSGTPVFPEDDPTAPFYVQTPSTTGVPLDRIAFIDDVHPTAATHAVLGSFIAGAIGTVPVLGNAGDNILFGGDGKQMILASDGDDRINAGAADDIVLAGLGDDLVRGGTSSDILSGGSGEDTLRGGRGADVVAGGDGDDIMSGGRGADLLIDGLGSDVAVGGDGDDSFLFVEAAAAGLADQGDSDLFRGGAGTDTVYLVVTEETQALLQAEIAEGGVNQSFDAIGLTTIGVEQVIFLADADDITEFDLAARVDEAQLWGFV